MHLRTGVRFPPPPLSKRLESHEVGTSQLPGFQEGSKAATWQGQIPMSGGRRECAECLSYYDDERERACLPLEAPIHSGLRAHPAGPARVAQEARAVRV